MEREIPKNLDELEAQFWVGNKKASEIWRKIRRDMDKVGFPWAKYLRLLKLMRREVILYEMGELSLTLFIGYIVNHAKGPLGKHILKERG